MSTQYRNSDRPTAPQVVSIQWEQIETPDDSGDAPDERDDGFWPSQDPDAAGYVEPGIFDQEMEKARARMAAFDADEWGYVGVIARAHVSIPIGGGSFVTYTLDSPGLWGIESEAESASYRASVFEEQKAELWTHLQTLATFVTAADSVVA